MRKQTKLVRPRPDVYQQALNAAKKRIEKALQEKADCEGLLKRLNEEIPRLQRIIDVFEPEPRQESLIDEKTWSQRMHEETLKSNLRSAMVKPSLEALKQVPDHLKRFMQPVETEPAVGSDGTEDRFLPDVE